ncbi:MAG: long-chain fatty acid--CoA ligase [Proteobacteria bacterium]|nr:long-chain fatty acid--CoA ligase [Pseudomonadota bacterium]
MMIFDILQRRADYEPDKRALVDLASGRAYTYAQANARASAVAEVLAAHCKLSSGARVALLMQNCTEFFEILFGCAKAGMIAVPLNWRLAAPELQGILQDCTPDLLIYDAQFAPTIAALKELTPGLQCIALGGQSDDAVDPAYEVLLTQTSGKPVIMPERALTDTWYILYTSGTTGKPKGVIQTYGMALFNHLNIGAPMALTSADVTLNLLPLFHTGGINLLTMPTLLAGGTALIMKSFDAGSALQLFSREVTAFFGVPAIYLMLSQHPDFAQADLARVRVMACGGAPLPISVLDLYAERGVVIRQGFGMTETGPTVFLMDEQNVRRKAGAVGKPAMFVAARVVDAAGKDLPPDAIGELLLRGPAITPGYWQQAEKTAEAFTADGWLRTGDLARRDEENYFYIVDRSKDMFISGGENVYPAEVENVLFQHPAVLEAAVLGLPDPKWGESGLAVVACKPGQEVSAENLLAFCNDRLARYKLPKHIAFVPSLPRNAAGKVVKPELRKLYAPRFIV